MELSRTHFETDDFDALVAWESARGLESEKTQLSRGRGRFSADILQLGDMVLLRERLDGRMMSEYANAPGTVEFAFVRDSGPAAWCGLEASETLMLIHQGGRSYSGISPSKVDYCGVILPEAKVHEWELVPEKILAAACVPEGALFPANGLMVEAIQGEFEGRVLPQTGEMKTLSAMAATHLHEEILTCLHEAIDDSLRRGFDESPHHLPNAGVVNRARELIASRLDEPLAIDVVAQAVGSSRRTLERAFREMFGMSPYQYLTVQRLHAVRRLLKQGKPVLDACVEYGFENAGRFAGIYARHFGELPSETRKGGRKDGGVILADRSLVAAA